MTEQVLEQATGKDVDVEMQGDTIRIEDESARTEIAETTTWPADLSADVPQFTAGRIERVVKSESQGDTWSYNIYLAGIDGADIKGYRDVLKEKGWETTMMEM